MSTPTQIRLYYHVYEQRLLTPGGTHAPKDRIILPRQDYIALVINAVKSDQFVPDEFGYAPASVQYPLSVFTGTPVAAIKTLTAWEAGTTTFTEAWNGYLNGYAAHSLDAGRVVIPIVPSSSIATSTEYAFQVRLAEGTSYYLRIPVGMLKCTVQNPVILGTESGSVDTPWSLSGNVTFAEGEDVKNVTVTGLTSATGQVVITQKYTAGGLTSFAWSCPSTGTLRITAGGTAPAETWVVTYDVRHL